MNIIKRIKNAVKCLRQDCIVIKEMELHETRHGGGIPLSSLFRADRQEQIDKFKDGIIEKTLKDVRHFIKFNTNESGPFLMVNSLLEIIDREETL